MTNNSKENLLKILLNDKNEKGQSTGGTYANIRLQGVTGSNWEQKEYLTFNGYTIILLITGEVKLIDSENNVLMQKYLYINNEIWIVRSICVDNEGMFYAYTSKNGVNGVFKLVYLNNITEKTIKGEYELVPRKTYDLAPMWSDIRSQIASASTNQYTSNSERIFKSPIDNRIMFVFGGRTSNAQEYTLLIVEYSVNFEGGNSWQFRATSISDYSVFQVENCFVGWTQENADVSLLGINSDWDWSFQTTAPISVWAAKVDFSEGSQITTTRLLEVENYLGTMPETAALKGLQPSLNLSYLPINVKNTTTGSITTRIYRYNGKTFKKIYEYQYGENAKINNMFPILINNLTFFCLLGYRTENEDNIYIKKIIHILKEQIYEFDIVGAGYNTYAVITSNNSDVYFWYVGNYFGTYVYRTGDYNGTPYFSNESLTSSSSKLYTDNVYNSIDYRYPIYAKELYDRVLGGNTINSVIQVPYNVLNNMPIIQEDLLSRTNSIISSDSKEITKNQYEELYINNIDTFKVWDNNNGSTYNQNASIQIAKNIYNGFTDEYKIKKYRINYNDSSYSDYDLEKPTRTNNEATIKIGVYNTGIKNIEIYDDNFTTPFITIDLSNLELNKLYTIIQKIKIE